MNTVIHVCRVSPDVIAVERAFDYSVPDEHRENVRVGAIVRAALHGRRVRGWVVADNVESEVDPATLRPLLAVTSVGPPESVVALAGWAAHRYCGSRVALLRSASPSNNVGPGTVKPVPATAAVPDAWPEAESDIEREALALARTTRDAPFAALRWPPLLDRRLLVAQLLAREGSSLVIVADASRGRSLVDWLRRAGARAVLMHSDLSAAERTRSWAIAASGRVIVVGGRIAALAPVPDLQRAIVVDDSDAALQEERTPTWHARELLAERCRRVGGRFVVVSAAPSVEAEVLATIVHAPARAVEAAGWPRIEVVDRGEEPPSVGLLSERLARALHDARDAKGPAVCVLNRRGRVRLFACATCLRLVRWDRDGAPVWDKPSDAPVAIGTVPTPRPDVCPHCGGTRLRVLRSGITRVREEVAALLPGTTVVEVDAGTETIADVGTTGVLVGTEAALQRVEVRRLRPVLVAFLDFDQELLAPRSRAAEQALWLIVRAGRLVAARDRSRTRVLLQTRLSDHEVVRAAVTGDPALVADAERARRRALGFPPFGGLAEISGAAAAVDSAAAVLTEGAGNRADISVLGPDRKGETARCLVRGPDPQAVADALAAAVPSARALGRLHVEVDPMRI